MAHIAQNSLATIYFTFTWKSSHASHIEAYLAKNVSFTRDILPLGVKSRMRGLGEGDSVEMELDPSEIPGFKPGKVLDMPITRFQAPVVDGQNIRPRIGRYYPKHFIENVPGTRPDSATPFRVVEVDKSGFKADLNHPMASREVTIKGTVVDIDEPGAEAGKLIRWPDAFFKGPGKQARLPETPTDYLGVDPFDREDESNDADFYAVPRKVHHLDSQARANVQKLYAKHLKDGMKVLDLMAGYDSHLPDGLKPESVTGLGLNAEEMSENPAIDDHVIHNLNEEPTLPFEDGSYDAVICTVSVEYLTKPFEVFEEAARILKQGGIFIVTFSNRWFEPKAIRIWPELHEFERMGMVSQFFIRSEMYSGLTTFSERGWPRPDDAEDRYSGSLPESDPIYAVWGLKK